MDDVNNVLPILHSKLPNAGSDRKHLIYLSKSSYEYELNNFPNNMFVRPQVSY